MFSIERRENMLKSVLVSVGDKDLTKSVITYQSDNLLYPHSIELIKYIVEKEDWVVSRFSFYIIELRKLQCNKK